MSDLAFLAIVIAALASGSQMLSIDSDLGRHLTRKLYPRTSRHPNKTICSPHIDRESRPPYEWLSQVAFAISYRLLDDGGSCSQP
ncbi:MAG: hypothetical protein U0V48_16840 [Anaerolineales bacterium]